MSSSEESPARSEALSLLMERGRLVEEYLKSALGGRQCVPPRLASAMLHSLTAGGKRIRPALCMACAAMCGMPVRQVLPFAAAIEMIHTYSLIHDDLPAMDNDDLRRGKPSCHKAFDEATAILAGDGLLTDAFHMICGMDAPAALVLRATAELAQAAGSCGMVGGQMLDMLQTGKKGVQLEELRAMQAAKTGAILRASCVCGAILAGASARDIELVGEYGLAFGRAFQIVDDILDVTGDVKTLGKPAGSDEAAGKNTWPLLVGLAESKRLAQAETAEAISALAAFSGSEASFLRELALFSLERSA